MATTTGSPADWMDMTISDWLDVTPSEWIDRTMPGWREGSYGDFMRTSPRDWLSVMYGPLSSQTPWTTMPTTWPPMQPMPRRRHYEHPCHEHHKRHEHHRHERRCRHCGRDACECYCCIGDVDVVVYARVGELRIVPIRVENERHREREIKVELSSFRTRGGKEGLVQAAVRPQEFTLAPCAEQELVLAFHVGELEGDQGGGGKDAGLHVRAVEAVEQRRLPDVDGCEVLTCDLRLVGCDQRSLRIAAAILPRDCDPFQVSCGCTCC